MTYRKDTMGLWQAPSGFLHSMRGCSGGAGRRMRRVRLTQEQWTAAPAKCRCCPATFKPGWERP